MSDVELLNRLGNALREQDLRWGLYGDDSKQALRDYDQYFENATPQPTFADALRIARGCLYDNSTFDTQVEYRNEGIEKVATALEQAAKSGLNDPQVAALWKAGGEK
jgi:hypothetical protein